MTYHPTQKVVKDIQKRSLTGRTSKAVRIYGSLITQQKYAQWERQLQRVNAEIQNMRALREPSWSQHYQRQVALQLDLQRKINKYAEYIKHV